ncbi:hypothetical protein PV328_003078 [Microctonus aethiopoides]|uniref:Uncharacterized protein n=1 Tax=Microctonus aethiopoides TaxID=144406 RepID=A0AA39F7V8_9HYME|nr:hypothetical protein PV328_003078 [Microctonus aethiopoides]
MIDANGEHQVLQVIFILKDASVLTKAMQGEIVKDELDSQHQQTRSSPKNSLYFHVRANCEDKDDNLNPTHRMFRQWYKKATMSYLWVGNELAQSLINLNTLPMLSCTDVKCSWKKDHKKVLETYIPRPLQEHNCFHKKKEIECVV